MQNLGGLLAVVGGIVLIVVGLRGTQAFVFPALFPPYNAPTPPAAPGKSPDTNPSHIVAA